MSHSLQHIPLAAAVVVALMWGRPAPAQEPLTLERAVALAQEQGYQGRAAVAARDAARYRDRGFYAAFMPQLSLGGTLPRYNRAIIPVLQPDGTTLFRPQNQTDAGLTASINQRLPTGGDLFVQSSLTTFSISGDQAVHTWSSTPVSLGIRQSLFRPNTFALDRRERPIISDLAERQYLAAREDLASQTTNLFFDMYSAGVALRNATANAAVNDTLYTLNKGRFEVGKIGENDLLQSELALLRARTAADAARLEYARTESALRLAVNLPAPAPLDLVIPAGTPEYVPDTAVAVAEASRNGTSAANVALSTVQAERRVSEARLNNGFSATVQASVGFNATAPEVGLAYQNLLQARQATISVELPLFTWGTGSNAVKAAESDREQIANLGRSTIEQAAQAARFAALQLPLARRNLALSAKADTVAAKRFEVAYNRYVIGRIAIDNLYLAQSEKDQASVQYLQALRGYWVAHYRLRSLTLYDFEAGKPIR
jgi:outer membrane protein TolC